MAKTSMIARETRRTQTVAKYAAKREQLKSLIKSPHTSNEERAEAVAKLQALPRDASPARGRKRCAITGRARGNYRRFGLGRTKLREATLRGEIPGLRKASW